LGVPYEEGFDQQATADYETQAARVVANLKDAGVEVAPNTEIVALIAYLQRLGTDIKQQPGASNR
jgi:cytochrome c oxidase cbb3-type subunit I/II